MLHLAQVQKKGFLGKAGLRLVARQKSENIWALVPEEDVLLSSEASSFNEGLLVLVELSSDREVISIREATDWVIDLIQKYLLHGITPGFLKQEAERAEQWRQSLTLQSQELDRRALELEARREQIQDLEESLKRERKQFDATASQIKSQSEELERCTVELEARRRQIHDLEENLARDREQLKRDKEQFDRMAAEFKAQANPSS
jgi:DNA repair exonuclease SbcCD ATPase subunit